MHAPGIFVVSVLGMVVGACYTAARAVFAHVMTTRAQQLERLVSTVALQVEDLIAAEPPLRALR